MLRKNCRAERKMTIWRKRSGCIRFGASQQDNNAHTRTHKHKYILQREAKQHEIVSTNNALYLTREIHLNLFRIKEIQKYILKQFGIILGCVCVCMFELGLQPSASLHLTISVFMCLFRSSSLWYVFYLCGMVARVCVSLSSHLSADMPLSYRTRTFYGNRFWYSGCISQLFIFFVHPLSYIF